MKKNRIILIITIVLLAIAIVLLISRRSSTLSRKHSDFAVKDTSTVTKIFIVDKNNKSVLLEKMGPSEWKLNKKYKAHNYQISDLLKMMMDLVVRTPVPKSARNNIISRMSVKARKVEVYQELPLINLFGIVKLFTKERLSKTYYVGGNTQDNLGTFMLMKGSEQPFVVYIPRFRGFVGARYSIIEEDWRDHTIFNTRMQNIQSIEMQFNEEPEESYRVDNLGNDRYVLTTMIDNQEKPFDTLRMLNFLTSFADIRFEAVLTNTIEQYFIDSVTSLTPAHIITLIDRYGKTTKVVTFRKAVFADELRTEEELQQMPYDFDRLYALINNEEDFVLIQYFVFDKILRPASYFK